MRANEMKSYQDSISRKQVIKLFLSAFAEPYIATVQWLRTLLFPFKPEQQITSIINDQTIIGGITSFLSTIIPQFETTPSPETDSFTLRGGKTGIIITHGFGSNPSEIAEFARKLHEKGYTVMALRLPGHGTSPDHFSLVRFEDWYIAIKNAIRELNKETEEIILIGHSMGATLSLLASAFNPVSAVVTICAPIELHPPFYALLPTVSNFVAKWPRTPSSLKKIREANVKSYQIVPLNMVIELFNLMEVTRKFMHTVSSPALVIAAKNDKVVPMENAQRIYKTISSPIKKMWIAPNSTHQVFIDKVDFDELLDQIVSFIESERKKEEKLRERET